MTRKGEPENKLTRWEQLRDEWDIMSIYQRFESMVSLVITAVIGLIIVVALARLCITVVAGLLLGALDPLEPGVFQTVFGEVLTVLIALEFNHTLQFVVARHQSIIQTKVVLLIAMLALARKVIVLDYEKTSWETIVAIAAVTLALGIVYWLMRERDDRLAGALKTPTD